jgi:CRP/FNR family transcriptional regulator, cyclic AMP receptor protein
VPGVEILRRVALFAGLDQSELDLLAATARRVQFPRGSIVFQEGDQGDFLLVLAKGRVKVSLLGENGAETVVSFLEPPAVLGEIALLDESPRSATVMTLEATEFLQIGRAPFLALIKRHPAVALRIMAQLSRALRRVTEHVRSLAMFDVHGRMLRALLVLAQEQGERDRARMTIRPQPRIKDLALMCGCTREAAGRALKVLHAAGYLTDDSDGLVVEARAIRKYLQPPLAHVTSPGAPSSGDRSG